eukprot:3064805-Amphidinium_carterae.1
MGRIEESLRFVGNSIAHFIQKVMPGGSMLLRVAHPNPQRVPINLMVYCIIEDAVLVEDAVQNELLCGLDVE